ncbi:hypothetical protein SMG44B_20185 [Stenotrophomonas maltophilia]
MLYGGLRKIFHKIGGRTSFGNSACTEESRQRHYEAAIRVHNVRGLHGFAVLRTRAG